MQPLNWDTAARTPLTDSFSLFTGPDPLRQPSESFGDHLYRSDSAPSGGTQYENESARPDLRAKQQPPPAAPASPPSPPAKPQDHHASPQRDDVNNEAADHEPAQPVDSAVKPTNPSSSSSESSTANEEPHADQVDAEQHDTKASAANRNKATSRRSTAAINGDLESANLTVESETQTKSKRVGTSGGKSKVAAKSKQNGRLQPSSGQTDSAAGSATNAVDGTRTAVVTDEQATSQSSKDSATDGPLNAVEETVANTAAAAQSKQLIAASVSTDATTQDAASDVDRSNRIGKRGPRTSRDERGIDGIASIGSSLSEEQLPETITALQQLDESSAKTASAETPAVTQSGKSLTPTTSASQGSVPTAPHLRFAQHLAAKPGVRAAKTSPLTDLEHARLVDRVARAFHTAEARGGTVTLRLHPPELGALRVELRVLDGALTARLEAETPTARTVLLDNVQMLHERLAEQGVRIERFDVDLLDRRSAGDSSGFDHQGPRDQDNRHQPTIDPSSHETRDIESNLSNSRPDASGKLNVVI